MRKRVESARGKGRDEDDQIGAAVATQNRAVK